MTEIILTSGILSLPSKWTPYSRPLQGVAARILGISPGLSRARGLPPAHCVSCGKHDARSGGANEEPPPPEGKGGSDRTQPHMAPGIGRCANRENPRKTGLAARAGTRNRGPTSLQIAVAQARRGLAYSDYFSIRGEGHQVAHWPEGFPKHSLLRGLDVGRPAPLREPCDAKKLPNSSRTQPDEPGEPLPLTRSHSGKVGPRRQGIAAIPMTVPSGRYWSGILAPQ